MNRVASAAASTTAATTAIQPARPCPSFEPGAIGDGPSEPEAGASTRQIASAVATNRAPSRPTARSVTPAGNPLAEGNPAFTFGHRNSFGLCMDPATGDLWETENGPDVDDEVNRLDPGGNYGWPEVTGDSGGRFADPVSVFPDTVALTGCVWWRGDLMVGAWNDGLVRRIDPATGGAAEEFGFPAGVTDLAVGPDGALFVATADAIWRLEAPASGSLGPSPIAPGSNDGQGRAGWIAVVAAVVLAAALATRFMAGRSLRAGSSEGRR